MVQMFDGENIYELDESSFIVKIYPSSWINNLSASTCNIYGSREGVYWLWITSLSARSDETMMSLPKYFSCCSYMYREQSDKKWHWNMASFFTSDHMSLQQKGGTPIYSVLQSSSL